MNAHRTVLKRIVAQNGQRARRGKSAGNMGDIWHGMRLTRAAMASRWVGEHNSPCHAAHPLTRAAMASRWIHKRYSSCDSAHLHLHTNPLNPRINIILTAVHRARHVLLYVWQTALISCPLSPIYAQAAPAHRKNSIDIHLPLEIKYNHRTHCACGHPYMKGAA